MQKNGLLDRSREVKVGKWAFGISFFFLASFFLAPLILPSGTVPELSSRANAIDYATVDGWGSYGNAGKVNNTFAWSELDPYTGFIYAFGDLNCHNKAERSWFINDNQMPVCARDIGIFAGLAIGSALFTRRGYNRWTVKDTCLSLLPDDWLRNVYQKNNRTVAWIGLGSLLCVPIILDGFTQLLTSYESNNIMRVLTGIPFGIGLGVLICAMYCAKPRFFDDVAQVKLPAGASFSLKHDVQEQE